MKNQSAYEPSQFLTRICCTLPFLTSIGFIIIWLVLPVFREYASLNMKFNTAIGLCLASISLWLLKEQSEANSFTKKISQILALLVLALGLTTRLEYFYGVNFGIDEFFVKDVLGDSGRMLAGRMSANAADAFTLLSLSLLLIDTKVKRFHVATFIMIPLNVLILFSILGYLFDEKLFQQVGTHVRVSMPTSLSFWSLSFAALFARVKDGPFKIFFSSGLGGVTARRLLPFITIVPILLTYIRLKMESEHFFNFELGFSLFSMSLLLLLLSAIIFVTRELDKTFFKKIEHQEKENLINLRLNMVLDATQIGTFEWDQKNNTLMWNHYHEILFGYEPGTSVRDIQDFNRRIHYQDLPRIYIDMQKALFTKSDYEHDFRIVLPSGLLRWMHSRGRYSYDENGNPTVLRGIVMDVSELRIKEQKIKDSEEKFRTITNTTPQMVWSCSATGEAEYFNNQWLSYTGVKEGECLGFNWMDFVHPEDRHRVMSLWLYSVKEKTLFQTEYRLKNYQGNYHWVLSRASPVFDSSGAVTQWFGTSTDIEVLKQAEVQLKQAVEARDEFLSITSHELKTPLTSLRLQTDLIKRSIESGDYKNLTEEQLNFTATLIDKQIERLNRLINDMVDVTRIRSGHLSLNKEDFDILSLAEEVIERVRPMFAANNNELNFDKPSERIVVRCDKMRIEQVMINLLTNALRYGEGWPITLKIEKTNGKTVLSVKDRGIGIEKANHEKIFNRFERVSAENSIAGIGLGLFIVKELVQSHGGRIWLDSEVGKGSTFYIEL